MGYFTYLPICSQSLESESGAISRGTRRILPGLSRNFRPACLCVHSNRDGRMPGLRAVQPFLKAALLASVLVILGSVTLSAQVTSTIQGNISDPSGAAVPGAKVTATNEETGVSGIVTSAADGYYRIPDLLAGTYRVMVENPGFKTIVRNGVAVTAKTVVGQNFTLELGAVTEKVTVTAEAPLVETQTARINETINKRELGSLPMLGRSPLQLAFLTPGITGKFEGFGRSAYCCDVFGVLLTAPITSGSNEYKQNITVDGLSTEYGDGPLWGLAFTPNPDAVEEVNVATSPYSAETGRISGPLVQLITKGGTNFLHGSAHFTFQREPTNAVPFRSTRANIKGSNYRLFGGTLGGPIKRDRLFAFFAYEGRRARRTNSFVDTAETEAFKNFVVSTRPNSIAATLLQAFPPLRYPTTGLVDLTGIGFPEIGNVVVDKPILQGGRQFNGRIDYHMPNNKDRIYGSYWYSRPSQTGTDLRPAFAIDFFTWVDYVNVAHSHAFSPTVINEARFGISETGADNRHPNNGAYYVPAIATDDGLSLGNFAWSLDVWQTHVKEFGDTLSINRGRHGIKLGGGFSRRWLGYQSLIGHDTPEYDFGSVLDFANDSPYREIRSVDVLTGKANKTDARQGHNELNVFMQNTWQVHPNLTLNYGLRYEVLYPPWQTQAGKQTWQPVLSSNQLTPTGITNVINQRVSRFADTDLKNFGPRIGVAWDPTRKGKMSIRANFSILRDQLNALQMYSVSANPPGTAEAFAGPDVGVPIVYGLAPVGTRDFPPNPNLAAPQLTPQGGFVGARPDLAGLVTDLKNPKVYDWFTGVQYQVLPTVMVFGDFRYRRTTNDVLADDLNRFEGDLLSGRLNRLNPNFGVINLLGNWGKRYYHGLVFGVSKRMASGWSVSAHYTYNNARNNFARVSDYPDSTSTVPFRPDFDLGRDDIPHVFTFRNVWELPIFRRRSDWVGKALGGWQLNSLWNLQSGGIFTPVSTARYGRGGDFNADGRQFDRPDKPATAFACSFSTSQWLQGALKANVFPLPDPSQPPRDGTLPKDYCRGPGYARIDIAAAKEVPIRERVRVQFRAEAFNALNRINIDRVQNRINRSNFGQVTRAYAMRVVQFELRMTF